MSEKEHQPAPKPVAHDQRSDQPLKKIADTQDEAKETAESEADKQR